MSLFGFDAFLDWERGEAELRFWFCVVTLAPVLLCVAANVLLTHITWPHSRRMR